MSKYAVELNQITRLFEECGKTISAIGDETRQHIIVALLECGCQGMRVGTIAEKTHLSRPAVSHHLKILKEAQVIEMRREGTKNYYFLNPSNKQWQNILELMNTINTLALDTAETECNFEGGNNGYFRSNETAALCAQLHRQAD